MIRYFKTIFAVAVPFVLAMCGAYLVGSFINVSWNPIDWERDARMVTSIWGLVFGGMMYTKLHFEGLV